MFINYLCTDQKKKNQTKKPPQNIGSVTIAVDSQQAFQTCHQSQNAHLNEMQF